MDVTAQVYEEDATGWLRGLYDDVEATFRAPLVNWIFRTTAANYPEFLRYAWGQVEPIFGTRAFGNCSTAYRDAVLSGVEVPTYRRAGLGLAPAEFRELRGQLASFDIVAPRLAVLFETVDRGLQGELDPDPPDDRAATAPLPAWLDRDRGRSVTLTTVDDPEGAFAETVDSLRAVHGFGPVLPSIYRCLAQWPDYLTPAWRDLRPLLESGVDPAESHSVVESFVDGLAHWPRLSPADLERVGFDEETVADVAALFAGFNRGADGLVLPAIHLHAATVGVSGRRDPL